jgi:hypothetical protein
MPDLDALAPNYRRAQQRWPDAPTLARCYEALEACFMSSAHGLVEHVKSFVESVCLTIMAEFRAPMPSAQPSTTDLLVAALDPLGLRNTRGATMLDKVLSGFNRLADAISEMRNTAGPVAHGKDGFLDPVATDHARAFLHVGDAIVGILLDAFEGKQPDLISTREPYENFPHLNERIDRAVVLEASVDEDEDRPIVVFSVATGALGEAIELRIEPSRLLYGVDREAYVEVLRAAEPPGVEEEDSKEAKTEVSAGATGESPGPGIGPAERPVTELVTEYKGNLAALRAGVEPFLQAEGIDPAIIGADGVRLVDSLLATADQNLALDWKQREVTQARLKVACKRVLIRFGCRADESDAVADRFVSWLRVQAPDAPVAPGPTAAEQGPKHD